jgi:hypothetical protein
VKKDKRGSATEKEKVRVKETSLRVRRKKTVIDGHEYKSD